MTNKIQKFWLVHVEGAQRGPAHKHFGITSALNEAQRLAGLNPGVPVVILKSTAAFVAPRPEVKGLEIVEAVPRGDNGDDGIPF